MTGIFVLIVLIGLNAFFAASEIALISLNERKIEMLASEGNKKAKILHTLLKEPSQFLATIQIGITLAGFLASAFAADSFAGDLADLILATGVAIPRATLEAISIVVITLLLSYFTLVFGELVPKRLAMTKTEAISMFAAWPLKWIATIALPFVKLLTFSTNIILRLFRIDPNANDEEVTEEEIRMLLDDGSQLGTILESEKQMIDNIFELDNKVVADVMTHRTNIKAISIDTPLNEIIQMVTTEHHTRFPIYRESIDYIIGILHVKDLIPYTSMGSEQQARFDIESIMHKTLFVPESKRTDLMLKELQKEKLFMAVVLDEYGGTAGIVTIKDLLQEIVGELYDEYDVDEQKIIEVRPNTYVLSGLTSLDDVERFFYISLPTDEYETLSGFLIAQIGYIPSAEDHPIVKWEETMFKVEQANSKRIVQVKVTLSNR